MTDHQTPEAQHRALEAAAALLNRLQETVADHLSKGDALDETEGFYALVQIIETAPEITPIRLALGDDPQRFGDPTPASAGGRTA